MIEIVPYHTEWPEEFRAIAVRLRAELGSLALRIDHIGSTSVIDLAAKDKIDIQVTVAELSPALEQALNRAGYVRKLTVDSDHIPPGETDPENWRKWYFRQGEGMRQTHIHVRLPGLPNQRYPLLFRDYLRAHPQSAEAYARVKQQLARFHAEDIDAFCDIKDPVCDLILFAAEEWAKETAWQPGPSDG
jgi:GrpB-like predicted nucleotidyltransferase (UPF0157 family)